MKSASLSRRTVYSRSTNYSYRHASSRERRRSAQTKQKQAGRGRLVVGLVLTLVVVSGAFIGFKSGSTSADPKQAKTQASLATKQQPGISEPAPLTNKCASNTLSKFILIDTNERHFWACEKSKKVYDAPVITGIDRYEETITPPGTYKIYDKQTNQVLTGSDSAGSWNRPVKYWMPFLHNQHGIYGFHDADWRPASEFGSIDTRSDKGSHGCVELPDSAQTWLYDWAEVGTTLTIET